MMRKNRSNSYSISSRLKSFRDAGRGLIALLASEPNARIHLLVALIVIIAGSAMQVSATDWCLLILAIGWVWSAEAINTSIERLCDVVTLQEDQGIRIAKDVAAGAVLISAIGAALIGVLVFWKYLGVT